jgi:hypothetical protein
MGHDLEESGQCEQDLFTSLTLTAPVASLLVNSLTSLPQVPHLQSSLNQVAVLHNKPVLGNFLEVKERKEKPLPQNDPIES